MKFLATKFSMKPTIVSYLLVYKVHSNQVQIRIPFLPRDETLFKATNLRGEMELPQNGDHQ